MAAFHWCPIEQADLVIEFGPDGFQLSRVLESRSHAWATVCVAEAHTEAVAVRLAATILRDARIWLQTNSHVRRCRLVADPAHPHAPRRHLDSGDVLIRRPLPDAHYVVYLVLAMAPRRLSIALGDFTAAQDAIWLASELLRRMRAWLQIEPRLRRYRQVVPPVDHDSVADATWRGR